MGRQPPANERVAPILREWAAGKTESEIASELGVTTGVVGGIVQRSHGQDAERAKLEHMRNKAARGPAVYRDQVSFDREARVLQDWMEGWSASDIALRHSDAPTRNTAIGIVKRSRGEAAEKAKRAHAAASALRYPHRVPRVKRALKEPAQREKVVSVNVIAPNLSRAERKVAAIRAYAVNPPITRAELAECKAKNMTARQAAIQRVELRLIGNPTFEPRVEPEPDFYAHMKSDRAYRAALAALSREGNSTPSN